MAPHSSTLAWKIPWTEEPGRLQSMQSLRVGHDWATSLSLFTFHFSLSCIGKGNGNPLQRSCLKNPRDRGAWWAAIYGVAQSRTRLKRLSSSSSGWFWVGSRRQTLTKLVITHLKISWKYWTFLTTLSQLMQKLWLGFLGLLIRALVSYMVLLLSTYDSTYVSHDYFSPPIIGKLFNYY